MNKRLLANGKIRVIVAALTLLLSLGIGAGGVAHATTTTGSWHAFPGQQTLWQADVQQPINADGSSIFISGGHRVIPVKFSLMQGMGPFVFQSIGSGFSYLTFTPDTPMHVGDITTLAADYTFTTGDCHLGALRWSIHDSVRNANVFLYYGAAPNFTDCTTDSQSGTNMIGLADLRYDTTQIGGTFYDSYGDAASLLANDAIDSVSLVLDGGSAGDQVVSLGSATVNDNTFTPLPEAPLTQTCNLPSATLNWTKQGTSQTGEVVEQTTTDTPDTSAQFRQVDCKYINNLDTSTLFGPGLYFVSVVLDLPGGALSIDNSVRFTLR